MKIAVTCENMEINGLVPNTFKDSEFLMIIDADKNQIFKIYGKQDPENMVFAQKVLEHDCEAIICGPMEKEPFELLADAGVTRYNGSGRKVQKAYFAGTRRKSVVYFFSCYPALYGMTVCLYIFLADRKRQA